MEIGRIYPQRICVQIEFTDEEIGMLLDFLDNATAVLKDEKIKKASAFVSNELFRKLQAIEEDIKRVK